LKLEEHQSVRESVIKRKNDVAQAQMRKRRALQNTMLATTFKPANASIATGHVIEAKTEQTTATTTVNRSRRLRVN